VRLKLAEDDDAFWSQERSRAAVRANSFHVVILLRDSGNSGAAYHRP
jgi:hypothetical protein